MTNIAYKVAFNMPNLPNGFIIDHFTTDKDKVEGYNITTQEIFEKLLENNVAMMRAWEDSKGIKTADSTVSVVDPRPMTPAQPVDPAVIAANLAAKTEEAQNAQLFQDFLAWKKTQQGS